MNEKDKLLHESKEERESRFAKAKEEFKGKKSARPMGYIFPQRIKAAMNGEIPSITLSMNTTKYSEEELSEMKETKEEREQIFSSARVPLFCPNCKSLMKAKIDEKFFWIRGKCHKCVAEDETKMKIEGSFGNYEKIIILKNKLAFYTDAKVGLEEYFNSLKPYQEYVNHDGTLEKWEDTHYEETKSFVLNEMKQVDEEIKKLIDEFNELEKLDESSTAN